MKLFSPQTALTFLVGIIIGVIVMINDPGHKLQRWLIPDPPHSLDTPASLYVLGSDSVTTRQHMLYLQRKLAVLSVWRASLGGTNVSSFADAKALSNEYRLVGEQCRKLNDNLHWWRMRCREKGFCSQDDMELLPQISGTPFKES